MMRPQRARDGGSRADADSEEWAPEGEGKAHRREYLRRDSCVSGEECDGTLQRGFCRDEIKQGGIAGYYLSLNYSRMGFLIFGKKNFHL